MPLWDSIRCVCLIKSFLSYTNLKSEIEVAKKLPVYEMQNDDFNIVNQKMDYIQMEIDDMKDKIKDLEKKVYKK